MSFTISLIALVYPDPGGTGKNDALMQIAAAWLQRRNEGARDALLLIGVGFEDEPSFSVFLKPYGLASAELKAIPSEETKPTDAEELGETVASIARSWIVKSHRAAIPVVSWDRFIDRAAYPTDGWWWAGLEAVGDEQANWVEVLRAVLPASFSDQAATWATLLVHSLGYEAETEHEVYETTLQILALARWLTGFDAATENNFYDFSAKEALDAVDIDLTRLGFEAGRNHSPELDDYFDGNREADDFAAQCMLACLETRTRNIRDALSTCFGGDPALFWSLYSSIWPELNRSNQDGIDELLGLRARGMEDLDRPWRFVTRGWIDFAEE